METPNSTTNPTTCAIPVALVPPSTPGTFRYVAVKGSLHSSDCSIFGLTSAELEALTSRFNSKSTPIVNGVLMKGAPIAIINSLSQLGYSVVCSSGEAELTWTLQCEC